MKSFLLHAHDEPRFDARLQSALDLTRAFDGHLTLFHAIPMTMIIPTDPWGLTMADVTQTAKKDADAFQSRICEQLESENVRWDWISDVGFAGSRMMQHAALSDITIIGADDPGEYEGASQLAGILALQCRTPVLVTPEGAGGFDPACPVIVGWNGSIESSRAVRAAAPIARPSEQRNACASYREQDAQSRNAARLVGSSVISTGMVSARTS